MLNAYVLKGVIPCMMYTKHSADLHLDSSFSLNLIWVLVTAGDTILST